MSDLICHYLFVPLDANSAQARFWHRKPLTNTDALAAADVECDILQNLGTVVGVLRCQRLNGKLATGGPVGWWNASFPRLRFLIDLSVLSDAFKASKCDKTALIL